MAHDEIEDALDRYGSDLAAWPDATLAADARRWAMADRRFRARLDGARALDAGLLALRDEIDGELAATSDRVAAAVLAAVPRQRVSGRRWAMVAAAVLVAAALGALADLTILAPVGSQSFEVVVLDPLFLDPAGTLSP